ncbi:hypothetical protein JAAARDRAFT_205813 [Jaapia argillacea MUCL 33604]|uniref:Uncharacterized protein n=1 Tax=Jaapia argillacea MUCL 33604 TaxID=933084 RepID=A0A067QBB7_9AGAM|nr:hypothetical protein JAAARDRAFT_205813 [Jaapia argillacea MUCL 33604]
MPPTVACHGRIKTLWAEYVEYATPKLNPGVTLDAEFKRGMRLPDQKTVKGFIQWLATTLKGRLRKNITYNNLQFYFRTFFALIPRYALVYVPSELRLSTLAYSVSEEFMSFINLTNSPAKKIYANVVDGDIIIGFIWRDKQRFRTNRLRIQCVYTLNIFTIGSERPGAVLVSEMV